MLLAERLIEDNLKHLRLSIRKSKLTFPIIREHPGNLFDHLSLICVANQLIALQKMAAHFIYKCILITIRCMLLHILKNQL